MVSLRETLPPSPRRAPDLDEDFSRGVSPQRWVTSYLPHWTTRERAEARYRLVPAGIELKIDADQLDWRPEDAPMRVSNLQTGSFSGRLGSRRGTHRHREDQLVVRTETPQRLLFAPSRGRVEVTLTASGDENCMTACWLIGTEHLSADDSGEICVFEIDADAIGDTTHARMGVKAHHDPRMTTDMVEMPVPLDAAESHTWTVIWGEGETLIGCEGLLLRRIPQAPDYPLFLMIDLFEIGPPVGTYPKTSTVRRVRGWAD